MHYPDVKIGGSVGIFFSKEIHYTNLGKKNSYNKAYLRKAPPNEYNKKGFPITESLLFCFLPISGEIQHDGF